MITALSSFRLAVAWLNGWHGNSRMAQKMESMDLVQDQPKDQEFCYLLKLAALLFNLVLIGSAETPQKIVENALYNF